MRRKKLALLSLAALFCLLLSGCFVKTVDELYTLPRHSDEYDNLQKAIDEVMAAAGCEYCAPISGSNQQSVQLADLDGDGEEEAIVFAKTSDEKPLKAYVFDKIDVRRAALDDIACCVFHVPAPRQALDLMVK